MLTKKENRTFAIVYIIPFHIQNPAVVTYKWEQHNNMEGKELLGAYSPACMEFLAVMQRKNLEKKKKASSFLRDAQETAAAIKPDGGQNLSIIFFEKENQVLWTEGVSQGYGDCKAPNLIQRLHPSSSKFQKNVQVQNDEE